MPRRALPRPPHCPNANCDSHQHPAAWRLKRKGFFVRRHAPRRVQRYLCQHCGRSFSSQTFAVDYWLRHPGLLRRLFFRVLACSAYRQIARELGVSHATVQRQVERLGRHCLLLHERLRPRGAPREPLVLDGLRSFEAGQYWPFDLNFLIGASHFVYGFNEAELRRSGAMRPAQKRRRARLERHYGRPDPRATRQAVHELVGRIVPAGASAELHSDAHSAYPQALRALRRAARTIRHHVTPARAARTARNPLFPANLADLLLRHTGANHKRETIAFSKRRQGACYRAAIWVVWRNYLKWSSEQRRTAPPGVTVGAIARRLELAEVLARRELPGQAALGGWLAQCYYGRLRTRRLPQGRVHALRYAV